jgi:hypothetical protein
MQIRAVRCLHLAYPPSRQEIGAQRPTPSRQRIMPFLVHVEPAEPTLFVMRGADTGLIRLVCRNCVPARQPRS